MATTNGHPATPPADPSTTTRPSPPPPQPDPSVPLTSAQDEGLSRRPRDARTIHLILSQLGIHSYQERVPLQLLDFAYRYTSGVLSDSVRLAGEGYAGGGQQGERGKRGEDGAGVTLTALRQAIASRQSYTFAGPLGKEFMLEEAGERNRVALPGVEGGFGVLLPAEKFCLTGVGWGLEGEWDSEEEEVDEGGLRVEAAGENEDERMGGMDGVVEEDEDEEGVGRMEDVFGEEGAADVAMEQD